MTAFHSRLEPLNETKIWKNWSGFLVAPQYKYSLTNEYYAIRSSVSLLDTSPLFKYRISGPDSVRLLERIMSRDINRCKVGGAQYTVWSDEKGFVIQDGVILRTSEFEFYLTAGEPTLRYFKSIAREMQLDEVTVDDISSLRSRTFRLLFFVPVPVSTLGRARVGSFGYWRASLTGPLMG